jgi:hypothetical protein
MKDEERRNFIRKALTRAILNPIRAKPKTPRNLRCSFCGKKQNEVKKLIAGPRFTFVESVWHCASRSCGKKESKSILTRVLSLTRGLRLMSKMLASKARFLHHGLAASR